MLHQEDFFLSHDGLRLFQQSWLPVGPARGAVAVAHGFTEHSGRFAATAERLVDEGFAVHAMDHRGHGRSTGSRCFVRRFDQYVDDFQVFVSRVASRQPTDPRFVLGHSMGGLIAARWAIRFQPRIAGLVLSGPALRFRDDLFPILRRLATVASILLPRLRMVRVSGGGISRDLSVVERYRADPLVFHGRIPVRTGAEIFHAADEACRHFEDLRLPLLLLHGTADRVCDIAGSRELYRRGGSPDKTLHAYEGLWHEVLSEPERAEVLGHFIAWLRARAGDPGGRK